MCLLQTEICDLLHFLHYKCRVGLCDNFCGLIVLLFHPSWTDFSLAFQTASNICVLVVVSKMWRMLGVRVPLYLELFGLAQPFPVDVGVSLTCRSQKLSSAVPPAGPCALSLCNWSHRDLFLNKEKIGMQKKANPSWDILDLGTLSPTFHVFWTSWHIMATFSIPVWHWWGKNNKFLSQASQ